MNKGLNRKSSYFSKEVGNSGTIYSNLNKDEGGVYLDIALYTTPGISPFTFSLNMSSYFFDIVDVYGEGFREKFFMHWIMMKKMR